LYFNSKIKLVSFCSKYRLPPVPSKNANMHVLASFRDSSALDRSSRKELMVKVFRLNLSIYELSNYLKCFLIHFFQTFQLCTIQKGKKS
jgi:hypothetical protein